MVTPLRHFCHNIFSQNRLKAEMLHSVHRKRMRGTYSCLYFQILTLLNLWERDPYLDPVPGLVSPCRKQKNTTKWREHFFMLWTSLGLPPRQQISFMESIVLDDDTERGRETVCITVSHCFTSYQYKHDTVTQWEEPTQDHCFDYSERHQAVTHWTLVFTASQCKYSF